MNVHYPYIIALCIISGDIDVKSSCNIFYFREQGNWRVWDQNFINAKTRFIARLVIIVGMYTLEEVFRPRLTHVI